MINRFYGHVSGNKYLTIDNIDKNNDVLKKYDQIFAGIKYHINKIDGNEVVYEKDYKKIKFSSDDDIPSNKMIYFPQVYLDDCLYHV